MCICECLGLYCISGEQELIAKTTFNWACVYKMLPSCPSYIYKNKWLSQEIFLLQVYNIHCVVYMNYRIYFYLDAATCAATPSVSP